MMLVALLISLTLPTLLSSLGQASLEVSGRKLELIAEDIAITVEKMAAAGPGNVRVVQMPTDLPADMRVVMGGAEGTVESVRLTWSVDGMEMGSRYLSGTSVLTNDGRPLILSAGDQVRLSCPSESWGEVVAVRV